jgi:hypothetical protein
MSRLSLAAGLLVLSCASGGGRCALPAVEGRIVDRATRAPIAGALVVEEWRGGGGSDAASPHYARFATSDAGGRFALPAARAPGLGFAWRAGRAPLYAFVHADYGLVRVGEIPSTGAAELAGARGDEASLRALGALCETAPSGVWQREMQARACSSRRR